jgi:transposase
MLYLGLDVHSKWTTIKGFDPETGEIVEHREVSNEPEAMEAVLGSLSAPLHGALESGTNSWAMYCQLWPFFERLVIADPAQVWDRRRDRGAKTDARDALGLAQKLQRGEIKGIYVPEEPIQDLRVLVRSKVRATCWVTKLTNEIGALLRSWGYIGPKSLLSKKGTKLLDQAQLPTHSARVLRLWREMLEKAQEIQAELEAAVKEEADADPMCTQLRTIPSVGPFTALVVRAELGEVDRFPGSPALISYAGLAPRVFQSGERCRYGSLGHSGNRWLRYALVLLANRMAYHGQGSRLHKLYWRLQLREHRNGAKIAVARKAAHLIYHMLRSGQPWREPDQEAQIKVRA